MNLNKYSPILFVVTTLFLRIIASNEFMPAQETPLSLLNILAHSKDMLQKYPTRSYECFNYFIPLIDQITKKYQVNYEACLSASKFAISQVEASTLDKRNDLAARADKSCGLLSNCSYIESAAKVLECYVVAGTVSVKTLNGIRSDAAEYLSDLQEEYRSITNLEYKCTSSTRRTYEKESSEIYADLNNCILGVVGLPTPPETSAQNENNESPEVPENTAALESTHLY